MTTAAIYDDAPVTRREFNEFREEAATKEDVRQVREEVRGWRDEVRTEVRGVREDVHRDLQHYATKADVAEAKSEIIKWMVWLMMGSAVAGSAIVSTVDRILGG